MERSGRSLVLLAIALLCSGHLVLGSHFRGGTISWEYMGGNKVWDFSEFCYWVQVPVYFHVNCWANHFISQLFHGWSHIRNNISRDLKLLCSKSQLSMYSHRTDMTSCKINHHTCSSAQQWSRVINVTFKELVNYKMCFKSSFIRRLQSVTGVLGVTLENIPMRLSFVKYSCYYNYDYY